MEHTIHPAFSSPIYSSFINVSSKPAWSSIEFRSYGEHDTSCTNAILDRPEWSTIRTQIEEHVHNYFFNVLKFSPGPKPYITISWASRSGYKQYHHKHAHANSVVSGTIYFANEDCGIVFHKPVFSTIECDVVESNIYNSGQLMIKPLEGQILLWPSHLEHWTETVINPRHTRYSLNFNIWVKGDISKSHTAGLYV